METGNEKTKNMFDGPLTDEARKRLREQIKRDTDVYLAGGGEIEQLPPDKINNQVYKPAREGEE